MSLFGTKEKREIEKLKKQLRIREKIDENNKMIIENMDRIIAARTKEVALQDDRIIILQKKQRDERATYAWKAELLRQMLIFKNQKLAELEESKELIRQEKLRMEDRVEELQKELLNERERADKYADAVSASMEYGWESVPEEKMVVAGFTKTETGWKA